MELASSSACPLSTVLPTKPRTQTAADWPVQVLLVEDSEEAAWLVQNCLTANEGKEFRIEWRQSVVEAMARLAEPGIEVILLDLGLPELNGFRSFRAIDAAAGGKLPVVILTSDDRGVSKDLTVGSGASAYLMKDRISPFQLRQTLLDALRQGRRTNIA